MNSVLERIQLWYTAQCDGDWEHTKGIKIDTIDNPGWSVVIDLPNAIGERGEWEGLHVDNGEDDWVRCGTEGKTYVGVGDPSKLEVILSHFLDEMN